MERRYAILFFATMFLIGTDTFIISPLLPLLRNLYHVSTEQSAWLVGSYALGYAVFALIAGPLSDGWNRKHVMGFGMIGFALATMACGMADSFGLMLLFRFLAGVCSAFIGPQVWAAIPILFAPARIGKAMGIVMAGLSVSQLVGVPLGSFLAAYDWSLPFFTVGIASLINALILFWKLPDLPPLASSTDNTSSLRSILVRYRDLLALPGATTNFIAYFVFMTGVYAVFSFLGIWLSDQFRQTVTQIGVTTLFIGMGNTIGSLLSGWLLARWGKKSVMTIGLVCTALLYVLLPYMPGMGSVQPVLLLIFMLGGMLVPVLMGHLQTLSSTSRGTISSLANACMYAGTLFGSYVAGLLYSTHGFAAIAMTTAAAFLIAFTLFVRPVKKPLMARV